MRINFFSVILVLLVCSSFAKIFYLFDKVSIEFAQTKNFTKSLFLIESAVASEANKNKTETKEEGQQKDSDKKDTGVKPDNITANATAQDEDLINPVNILDISLRGDEINLLKNLQQRREKLDELEKQLSLKETMLNNTEAQLEKKIADIKAMEKRIVDLTVKLDAKSNVRIQSLARIYENMKPADAAKIFNDLDMPVLLEIVRSMKENKVAPVIAQLNPNRAREISLEIAKISDEISTLRK
jgi:flagellar motility protein MotE (MotC chaperone)